MLAESFQYYFERSFTPYIIDLLDQGPCHSTDLPAAGSFMAFPGSEGGLSLAKAQQPCCPLLQGD